MRQIEGRIRLLRRCRRACATSPGIGVKPSFYLSHINVVPSRRAAGAVQTVRGVTQSLPSERRTNVVPSRRAVGAVQIIPGRGVMPTAYPTHINVVPSRLPNMRQVKPSASVTAVSVPNLPNLPNFPNLPNSLKESKELF